jgi:type IV pilus assembly protein PilX
MITALIFLVILTIMGVTAARMSSLEERMAGNMRDRAVAFRAAEMGLRDAERDIMNKAEVGLIDSCSEFPAGEVGYGSSTGVTAILGLLAQPTYRVTCPGGPNDYTIKATAKGAKPGTEVILEEVLRLTES